MPTKISIVHVALERPQTPRIPIELVFLLLLRVLLLDALPLLATASHLSWRSLAFFVPPILLDTSLLGLPDLDFANQLVRFL